MKFSIIARNGTWHTYQLLEEGKRRGVEVEVRNIRSLNGWQKTIDDLGEVVLWRSSSLEIPLSRSVMMQRIDDKKYLFNRSLGENPLLAHKLYQQKAVNVLQTITGIPTYFFKTRKTLLEAIEKGFLKYPFVMKKNLSARGEGVFLIRGKDELKVENNLRDFVFQNFVENDGDVRVLVLGGVALGLIKRTRGTDEFRNNVSLGGVADDARDLPDAEDLKNKALSLASKFGLQFCGVDFIFDKTEKIWRFMEVNTVPQWQGFQEATGVNVAEKVLDYVVEMAKRGKEKTPRLVRDYYETFEENLRRADRFHFYSRLWLLNKDKKAKEELEKLKDWYLGNDNLEKRITGLMKTDDPNEEAVTERKKAYRKYPRLLGWNNLLFWWLAAKEIYGVDLKETLDKYFFAEDLIQLAKELRDDSETVHVLSSASMNYFYLVEAYLGEKVDVEWLWSIHTEKALAKNRDEIKRSLYFLSHLVIAGSKFYTNSISDPIYTEAVREMEKMIRENYFKCSLDMKFEFLVCARLVSYESVLQEIIWDEAERSLSPIGNFLVDTVNAWKHGFGNKLGRGEHRNVLYLIAFDKKHL